jgi:hypothetical protein
VRSQVQWIPQERARHEPLAEGLFLDEPLRDFKALVGRMIVNDNQFDIRERLSIDRLEALFNVRFMLITSDYDAG